MKKIYRAVLTQDNSLSRFSVRLIRDYRVSQFEKKDFKVLEISGGRRPLSREYLNVDAADDPETDVLTNLLDPLPFEDNYADQIVSVATLEHFTLNDVREVLKEFHRVLKPGGRLEIGVPSLEKIFAQYKEVGCTDELIRFVHGGLKDQYDIHFFVVDAKRFIQELKDVGFSEAMEEEYDFPRHKKDFMMKIVGIK